MLNMFSSCFFKLLQCYGNWNVTDRMEIKIILSGVWLLCPLPHWSHAAVNNNNAHMMWIYILDSMNTGRSFEVWISDANASFQMACTATTLVLKIVWLNVSLWENYPKFDLFPNKFMVSIDSFKSSSIWIVLIL